MEVILDMYVTSETIDFGKPPVFSLLAFYPGAIQQNVQRGDHWVEWREDRSILPIAHLMERAYRLNGMVVMKKPDLMTAKLILAQQRQTKLDATINVSIKSASGGKMWQGSYDFDCFVEKMLANQHDERGNLWETLQLKIIDNSEAMAMPQ
jgi:hypothetical protein